MEGHIAKNCCSGGEMEKEKEDTHTTMDTIPKTMVGMNVYKSAKRILGTGCTWLTVSFRSISMNSGLRKVTYKLDIRRSWVQNDLAKWIPFLL